MSTLLRALKTCCNVLRRKSIALISSRVSIFFTVFACGSNGGIFSTDENILRSFGDISIPFGAFSDVFTVPINPMEECSFSLDIF